MVYFSGDHVDIKAGFCNHLLPDNYSKHTKAEAYLKWTLQSHSPWLKVSGREWGRMWGWKPHKARIFLKKIQKAHNIG